ncbi:FepA family TonB-dependent siderophore receptor [Xinfangfangia sp. D13-10-4-6]|uniref:FepA family TonB-dependent siderophore receptor n=1 Tax=Pseudogemmobacter hezensis TaxID=2737662 RepID=UPI001555C79D|nr:FepA family TonB-dependent siderophore receptor [Pseudogemmobacter hezensis]NPD16979.1 FepA family TonB-dependent siderophore receptor [Pseudogemmobacter hezensis]
MLTSKSALVSGTALGLFLVAGFFSLPALAQTAEEDSEEGNLGTIVLSAEEQIKQSLGSSNITGDDLARTPVSNDLSEIIRKMPGVNLTGTSASGQRGNQRQIDIRGMGPENTLILIDGKPVLSRNSVRMGRSGERDSRGDSNWVAPELVERIEVLRGPAAARYGSGSAGGVVNIITKRPDTQITSIGLHYGWPQSGDEGSTGRVNFMTAGPLGERLSFRLTGNYNKTEADSLTINEDAVAPGAAVPAGREGVTNRDFGALLTWHAADGHDIDFEYSYGRQGNIFAGDTQNSIAPTTIVGDLAASGAETNRMTRSVFGVTHRGEYDFGKSFSYVQLETTKNTRNLEALAGGPEGSINSDEKSTITLDNFNAKTEWVIPVSIGGKETSLTLGAEYRREKKDDLATLRQATLPGVVIPGTPTDPADRNPISKQSMLSLYAEANIYWTESLTLTPGVRLDQASTFGSNFSPSLNGTWVINNEWTMKFGVARAFKAPNLFQMDEDYVYYTMGIGCPINYPANGGVGCYVVGNPDLKAETSVNKEIGFAYEGANGLTGSFTYFHNDYKNRIATGLTPITNAANPTTGAGHLLQWENTPEAVVAGIEGNIAFPIGEQFDFNANFTHMTESKNKQNGQPLSLIPDYTINASVNWYATEQLTVTTSATHYGKIKAATITATTGGTPNSTEPRESYTIANLGVVYDLNDTTRISGGVTNLFDKQLFRSAAGANTFNEPGRAFYVSLNKSF